LPLIVLAPAKRLGGGVLPDQVLGDIKRYRFSCHDHPRQKMLPPRGC
jgi:hypothetical protein